MLQQKALEAASVFPEKEGREVVRVTSVTLSQEKKKRGEKKRRTHVVVSHKGKKGGKNKRKYRQVEGPPCRFYEKERKKRALDRA